VRHLVYFVLKLIISYHEGQFILNNYQQALQILEEMPVRIQTLTSGRRVPEAQFMTWLDEERKYLLSKQSEPREDILGIEYVELLNRYHDAR
jgi:hypothetical protein